MKKTFLTTIFSLFLILYLTGCGQTGPLYLPPCSDVETVSDNDE